MNQPMRAALAEDSPQRMDVIEKLATAQARTDKRFRPITLEFLRTSISEWLVAGWDTFDVDIRDITEGGRVRQQRTVVLADKFASFVEHPDYTGIMIHIPSTERNMKQLASSHRDERWHIVQDDIREMVQIASDKIVPQRSAEAENAQPDIMGHVESEADVLRRKLAEAEGRLAAVQTQGEVPHVAAPSIPAPAVEETPALEPVDVQVANAKAQDAELTKRAKKLVHEEEADAIAALKAKSKNYWLTKEYNDTIMPKILSKKATLMG